jgi:molecular chaperone GrpE
MARVEQVPAQLHGSESITEVKAALCREMIGLADALEASLVAAHETLERLQGLDESEEDETEEPAEISEDGISEDEVSEQGSEQAALRASEETPEQVAEEVREEGVESSSLPELQPSRRPAFWQVKLREWVDRIAPPTTPLPPPAAAEASRQEMADELQKRLDETLGAMDQWLEGQQLIYERLQIVMQNSGVRQIESEGQSFDPARHRAVSVEACDDVPNGTIIGEERKGYTLDGRILRYAEVVVAKNE